MSDWAEVKKLKRECPICGKPDWCTLSLDGQYARCMRIANANPSKSGEGYIYRLEGDEIPQVIAKAAKPKAKLSHEQLADMHDRFRNDLKGYQIDELADQLGLHRNALKAVGVGWYEEYQAYSFPMRDGGGWVIGFSLRRSTGKKFAVPGSRNGLFIPPLNHRGQLFVVEGATDTAAMCQLDFDVVGRPSCTGGELHLVEMLMTRWPLGRVPRPSMVIVGERDKPGIAGARKLMRRMRAHLKDVTVMIPPAGYKDVREWIRDGVGRDDILAEVANQRSNYQNDNQEKSARRLRSALPSGRQASAK